MVTHNCHGKTKNLTAKTKYLAAKTRTSRQNQMLHGKSKIAFNWFCRGYWLWPWGICMVFAVYLVLPWGLWFCREVFGFVVSYFVFAVRFLVLPWKLWATVPFVPESLLQGGIPDLYFPCNFTKMIWNNLEYKHSSSTLFLIIHSMARSVFVNLRPWKTDRLPEKLAFQESLRMFFLTDFRWNFCGSLLY